VQRKVGHRVIESVVGGDAWVPDMSGADFPQGVF
jgi:hypothetical protein